ncbi:MAG: response regulator, partial [Steroidobacteraceae bacterium]
DRLSRWLARPEGVAEVNGIDGVNRRALLVEDEPAYASLMTEAIRVLEPPWAVHCACDGESALAAPGVFDLALIDIGLPDMSGLEVIEALARRSPDTLLLVVAAIANEGIVAEAIRRGACGYVLKRDTALSVAGAVQQALDGIYPISPALARQLVLMVRNDDREDVDPGKTPLLADRELEVLRHFSSGCRYAEVAERMHVSLSTVQTHVRNLYRKLSVHSRYQALEEARRLGLLNR